MVADWLTKNGAQQQTPDMCSINATLHRRASGTQLWHMTDCNCPQNQPRIAELLLMI